MIYVQSQQSSVIPVQSLVYLYSRTFLIHATAVLLARQKFFGEKLMEVECLQVVTITV